MGQGNASGKAGNYGVGHIRLSRSGVRDYDRTVVRIDDMAEVFGTTRAFDLAKNDMRGLTQNEATLLARQLAKTRNALRIKSAVAAATRTIARLQKREKAVDKKIPKYRVGSRSPVLNHLRLEKADLTSYRHKVTAHRRVLSLAAIYADAA